MDSEGRCEPEEFIVGMAWKSGGSQKFWEKQTKESIKVDTGEALPIAQPLRRLAWAERDIVRREVEKMKEQQIIVESESPWSSPPVLVKKKDGSVRFCVDYRKLNDVDDCRPITHYLV